MMKKYAILMMLTLIFILAILGTVSADSSTERVSISDSQPDNDSMFPSITPDGRYVAFDSDASNIVAFDTNDYRDVFVKDGWTGSITRVSTTATGAQATGGDSYGASITPNGRYIAFQSSANNLVSDDTNVKSDIFVKDGWTGAITRLSTSATGEQANGGCYDASITPDGRYIAFQSLASNLVSGDTNSVIDVFVKDGWTGAVTRVSTTSTGGQATGGGSYDPSITPDGRYVAFYSYATNLVSGDSNDKPDVFVKDGWTGAVTRVSTSATGVQATGGDSYNSVITPDGRYIAFESYATNLVSGDTNGACDIFVKDGWTGAITRVSTLSSGSQANGGSFNPSISSDGRYIVFETDATNFFNVMGFPMDNNGCKDIYLKDGWTGATKRISINANGGATDGASYAPAITPDGKYVAFYSFATGIFLGDTNGACDVFVRDVINSFNSRISTSSLKGAQAAGTGSPNSNLNLYPTVTSDGRYVVFSSYASNLVSGDTNDDWDIFVHDNLTNLTIRASTSATGEQANGGSWYSTITPDGRYVAFYSGASNLVDDDTNGAWDVFVKDMRTGKIIRVSTSASGVQGNYDSVYFDYGNPSITPDGRYVAFSSEATNLVSDDTNNVLDVFVKDIKTGTITRVSTNAEGGQSSGSSYNPSITSDGRYIVFESWSSNLVNGDNNNVRDIFVKDGWTGAITRVSTSTTGGQANGYSAYPVITPNGRYITFTSWASNLVSSDTNGVADVFVKDGWTGAIKRVSTSATGAEGNDDSQFASITSDGRYIAFASDANNLIASDTNSCSDIFVKDGWTGAITRVSVSTSGAQANSASFYQLYITPDGRYVAFSSFASNLVTSDTNDGCDIFVRRRW